MTDLRPGIAELGAQIAWADTDAAAAARDATDPDRGRLAELAEWLAATQGRWPPHRPARPRLAVLGAVGAPVAAIADAVGAGVREITVPDTPGDALAAGRPRRRRRGRRRRRPVGARRARHGRGPGRRGRGRRACSPAPSRSRCCRAAPTPSTPASGSPAPSTCATAGAGSRPCAASPTNCWPRSRTPRCRSPVGFVLPRGRAAARRWCSTAWSAVAAALLSQDTDARAAQWWQVADTSPDPAHVRAVDELGGRAAARPAHPRRRRHGRPAGHPVAAAPPPS